MASSAHSRVLELLAEARRALALKTRLVGAGKDPAAVEEALDGLYRDLGRAMVTAAEIDGGLLFAALRRPEPPDYELEREESWYSDEQELDPLGPRPVEPLFDPDELEDGPIPESLQSELDESTPVIPIEREFTDSETPKDFVVATIASLGSRASADPTTPVAQLRQGAPTPWKAALAELVGLLELPASFADADELAVESTRLQWATNELEPRLADFPADLRAAVLGLLGARAHHLKLRLDSDVGPRVLLDRLQRYRIEHHLPAVAALLPIPRPEHATWEEDARRWWTLLRTGYSTGSPEAATVAGPMTNRAE
jgi:hypothetical protein